MSKAVHFDDQVQEHVMSVDSQAHAQEVKNPQGVGIPMITNTPNGAAPVAGAAGLSWWWILLMVAIVIVVGYLVWRYYFKKPVKPDEL